jgi:hypothetical protein
LVGYVSAYYGYSNQTTYGFPGVTSYGYYETSAVKAYFSKLVGRNDRETATNVIGAVDDMIVYGRGGTGTRASAQTLSGSRPYSFICHDSSEFVVAALKAAGVPAFYVVGTVPVNNNGAIPINVNDGSGFSEHAWAVCYLKDENVWEFIETTSASKEKPFIARSRLDIIYEPEKIAIPGGAIFSFQSVYPLSVSYYLNYVYPDKITPTP